MLDANPTEFKRAHDAFYEPFLTLGGHALATFSSLDNFERLLIM